MRRSAILFAGCFCGFTVAAPTEPLTVVTEQFKPYQFVDASGAVQGYSTAIVQRVLQRAGLEYRIDIMPWARAYKTAQDKPNVLIFSLLQTSERIAQFQWLVPLCPLQVSLYRSSQRDDVAPTSIEDATRFVVGVEQGQANYQFLRQNGFRDGVNLQVVGHNHQLTEMLRKGRIDLMLVSDVYLHQLPARDQQLLHRIMPIPALEKMLYLATNLQTDPTLVAHIRHAAAQLPQPVACPPIVGTGSPID